MQAPGVQATEAAPSRLLHPDVLRGVALLGIALMNIEYFSRPFETFLMGVPAGLEGADRVAGLFVHVFVQGKFWTLFSMLFGAGFALMLASAQAAGRPFTGFFVARCAALLLIGLAHALLVWEGDILVSYALAGPALLLFARGFSNRALLGVAAALYALPCALVALGAAAMSLPGAMETVDVDGFLLEVAAAERILAKGTWLEGLGYRWDSLLRELVHWPLMELPMVLGMFLLGLVLVRTGLLRDPDAHRRSWRTITLAGLAAGGVLMAASVAVGTSFPAHPFWPPAAFALALALMASPLLMLGYVGLLLAGLRGAAAPALAWVAPAGRMPLSNYLAQTLVFSLLFFNHGLGLWGQVPRAWQLVLALGLFVLQVLLSGLWLRYFRTGPAEWLWRSLAQWRRLPMRRAPTPGSSPASVQ